MSNFLKTGSDKKLGGTSKNVRFNFVTCKCFSQWSEQNLNISTNHGGITNLRDLRENSTNIKKRYRTLRRF